MYEAVVTFSVSKNFHLTGYAFVKEGFLQKVVPNFWISTGVDVWFTVEIITQQYACIFDFWKNLVLQTSISASRERNEGIKENYWVTWFFF